MKRVTVYTMVFMQLLLMNFFVMGCDRSKDRISIDDGNISDSTGTEPDEPPDDPPPPPDNLVGAPGGAESAGGMSLELVAQKVLNGDYGQNLQRMLSDEISKCITQMAFERVVFIGPGDITSHIRINPDGNRSIMFDSGYIAKEIVEGEYGTEAREMLVPVINKNMKD